MAEKLLSGNIRVKGGGGGGVWLNQSAGFLLKPGKDIRHHQEAGGE